MKAMKKKKREYLLTMVLVDPELDEEPIKTRVLREDYLEWFTKFGLLNVKSIKVTHLKENA